VVSSLSSAGVKAIVAADNFNLAPVAVCALGGCANGSLTSVSALAADDGFSLASLNNGTVRAWGNGGDGQLGDGLTTDADTPVAVCAVGGCANGTLSAVRAIAAGDFGLALLNNDTVVSWGGNEAGQLGVGTTAGPDTCVAEGGPCSITPVRVHHLRRVKAISAQEFNGMAAN
jgi:alpha-tubulin suppressor-like RCC1 family protein